MDQIPSRYDTPLGMLVVHSVAHGTRTLPSSHLDTASLGKMLEQQTLIIKKSVNLLQELQLGQASHVVARIRVVNNAGKLLDQDFHDPNGDTTRKELVY